MARFTRPSRQLRRRGPIPSGGTPSGGKAALGWGVAAISLLLVAVPILLFNQQHSGDPFKVRRELRKF